MGLPCSPHSCCSSWRGWIQKENERFHYWQTIIALLQAYILPLLLFSCFLFDFGFHGYVMNHLSTLFFRWYSALGLNYFLVCVLKGGCSRTSSSESVVTARRRTLCGSPSILCTPTGCAETERPLRLSPASPLGTDATGHNHPDIAHAWHIAVRTHF